MIEVGTFVITTFRSSHSLSMVLAVFFIVQHIDAGHGSVFFYVTEEFSLSKVVRDYARNVNNRLKAETLETTVSHNTVVNTSFN